MNTPDKIVTRAEGATFYCADCRETYQDCDCRVYMSVDAAKARNKVSGGPRNTLSERVELPLIG